MDAALCVHGTAEAVFLLALQNGQSITSEPETGTMLDVAGSTKQIYPEQNEPATAISQHTGTAPELEGIGYWAIGKNFKVS